MTQFNESYWFKWKSTVVRELTDLRSWLAPQRELSPFTSIFLGGGTPSLVPLQHLIEVFSSVEKNFGWVPDAEITMEANPESVSENLFLELFNHTPINRISFGAQSFDERFLASLDRKTNPIQIHEALTALKKTGFRNFNLDLIFAIPGQTKNDVLKDIDCAVSYEPSHLSFYQLTLKSGHVLFKDLPCEDVCADLFEAGVDKLERSGYFQYEISNFARKGKESKHNLLYWAGGEYLGVGPSASSRLFKDGVFWHRKQSSDWEGYLNSSSQNPGFTPTTKEQTILEALFLEIRKSTGVEIDYFSDRYGYDLRMAKKLNVLKQGNFLEMENNRVRLTTRGRMLADSIALELFN